MTTSTLEPRRPAHTREPIPAPSPAPAAFPSPARPSTPAPAPTPAPAASPTPAPSPSSAPRTRPTFDDADLSPWRAPAHPVPLPASSNPDSNPDTSLAEPITPMQRWAHDLVLEMIRAQLPLEALAAQLGIPFSTLITYLHLPEVQAEINAYEALINLRARLIGEAARPISLRRLLDILESPAPRLTHHNPEADQRTLHRHAELIRRTATTITHESRALAPKPAPAPKPAQRTASERTSASASAPAAAPESLTDQRPQKGAPSASSGSSSSSSASSSSSPAPDQSAQEITAPAPPLPIAHSPLPSSSDPSFLSPLRDSDSSAASAFSSRSRHARDRPAA